MRANQRKSVLVFVDVVYRDLPAIRVVTKFALRPILPAVKIGVAVLAFVRSVRKVQICMTVAASNSRVTSPKRKTRLCVIELNLARNDFPASNGMAGFTWNIEPPMRALC